MTTPEEVEAGLRAVGYPDWTDLNQILWAAVPLADSSEVSIEELQRHVDDGSVFSWLETQFDVPRPRRDEPLFVDYLQRATNVGSYGVQSNGLLLLVAHCAEALQQGLAEFRAALD